MIVITGVYFPTGMAYSTNTLMNVRGQTWNLDRKIWPERAPQAPPCGRGQGAQYEGNFLSGKPRPVGGELHSRMLFDL